MKINTWHHANLASENISFKEKIKKSTSRKVEKVEKIAPLPKPLNDLFKREKEKRIDFLA